RPPQVHAQEHLGPILRFGAAGARMDRQDGVLAVVLAAQHLLDLPGLHLLVEGIERLTELGVDRLAGVGPLDQHGEIVALSLERQHEIAILLQPAPALLDLLRFGLVFPEIGGGRARFETRQLFNRLRDFKDSSGGRWLASQDPRNAFSDHRRWAWAYSNVFLSVAPLQH